jgi:hypothetical protein
MNKTDGNRVEEVQFFPTPTPGDDQPSLFEHLQVLHHSKPTDCVGGGELLQRLAVMDKEPIEQVPPSWIR